MSAPPKREFNASPINKPKMAATITIITLIVFFSITSTSGAYGETVKTVYI